MPEANNCYNLSPFSGRKAANRPVVSKRIHRVWLDKPAIARTFSRLLGQLSTAYLHTPTDRHMCNTSQWRGPQRALSSALGCEWRGPQRALSSATGARVECPCA
jgi:hypothetical protein